MFEQNIENPIISMEDALEILKDHYDKQGPLNELPSERDRNFLLHCSDGNKYVLKIANESESLETLEAQNAAMNHIALKSQKDLCQVPIPKVLRFKTAKLWYTINSEKCYGQDFANRRAVRQSVRSNKGVGAWQYQIISQSCYLC